jgi:hypothetical protein
MLKRYIGLVLVLLLSACGTRVAVKPDAPQDPHMRDLRGVVVETFSKKEDLEDFLQSAMNDGNCWKLKLSESMYRDKHNWTVVLECKEDK